MENMKTTEQKNAVKKKHENTPNQSPQKMGARKRIYVLNNRQRPITPAASVGQHNKTKNWPPRQLVIVQNRLNWKKRSLLDCKTK